MGLITLSCFLRKGYEDKLVLAGEESCRASRIRRQARSLLQVLSITYVSHSPPWLLLTMYSFSSCKSPMCLLISNIPCTDYRAISPSTALPSQRQMVLQLWESNPGPTNVNKARISTLVFHHMSAFSSVQRLAMGWLLLSFSRAPLRKNNPLWKMPRWFQGKLMRSEGMVGEGKASPTTIWLLLERVKY